MDAIARSNDGAREFILYDYNQLTQRFSSYTVIVTIYNPDDIVYRRRPIGGKIPLDKYSVELIK